MSGTIQVGPTQPLTHECAAAIAYGSDAIAKSVELRQLAYHTMADVQDLQGETHRATSAAITQKIAETVTLKVWKKESFFYVVAQTCTCQVTDIFIPYLQNRWYYPGPSHGKKEWVGPSENQLGV